MDICLHVGAHRTGTTGFQTLLESNRQGLTRAGIAFKGPKRTRSGLFAGLIKNPVGVTSAEVQLGLRSCGRINMETARLRRAGARAVILSEENMIGTMCENIASGSLYGQAGQRLERFAPAFEGTQPQIWLSTRSYDMHWASQLAFRIQVGALVPDSWTIAALAAQPRSWPDLVVSLKQALPNARIVVWRFEDWVGRPGALLDALMGRAIGLPQAPSKPSNASDSARALAKLVEARGDTNGALHLEAHDQNRRYMPFSAGQQAQMQQNYRDDLSWLQAGAEGCATYLDPTEGTFGGRDMTRGSPDDRQEAGVARPR